MKQLIIVRKDLGMSLGKMADQVSQASMAFVGALMAANSVQVPNCKGALSGYRTDAKEEDMRPELYRREDLFKMAKNAFDKKKSYFYYRPVNPDDPYSELEECEYGYDMYRIEFKIGKDLYEQWFEGSRAKKICGAKNQEELLKAVSMAEKAGLVEGQDFFLIKDNCLARAESEEIGEDGIGRAITCIGFRPLPDEMVREISEMYELCE